MHKYFRASLLEIRMPGQPAAHFFISTMVPSKYNTLYLYLKKKKKTLIEVTIYRVIDGIKWFCRGFQATPGLVTTRNHFQH